MLYKLTYPWQDKPEAFSTKEKAIHEGERAMTRAEQAWLEYDPRTIVITRGRAKVGHFNLFGNFKETR